MLVRMYGMQFRTTLQKIDEAEKYLLEHQVVLMDMIAGAAKTSLVHKLFEGNLLDMSPTNSLASEKTEKYGDPCQTLHSYFKNIPREGRFLAEFDENKQIEGKSIFEYVWFIDECFMYSWTDAARDTLVEAKRRGTKLILAGDSRQLGTNENSIEFFESLADCCLECRFSYRAKTTEDLAVFQKLYDAVENKKGVVLSEHFPTAQFKLQDFYDRKEERWLTSSRAHEWELYSLKTEGQTLGLPGVKEDKQPYSAPYVALECFNQHRCYNQLASILTVQRAQGLDLDEPLNVLVHFNVNKKVPAGFESLAYVAGTRNKSVNNTQFVHGWLDPPIAWAPVKDLDRAVLEGKEYKETKTAILVSRFIKAELDKYFRKQDLVGYRDDFYTIGGKLVKLDIETKKPQITLGRVLVGFWSSILFERLMEPVIHKLMDYEPIGYSLVNAGAEVFQIDANKSHYHILAQHQVPLAYSFSEEPIEDGIRLLYIEGKHTERLTYSGLVYDLPGVLDRIAPSKVTEVAWMKFGWTDGSMDLRKLLESDKQKGFKGLPIGQLQNKGIAITEQGSTVWLRKWSGLLLQILISTVYFSRIVTMLDAFGDALVSTNVDAYNFGPVDIHEIIKKTNELLPTVPYKCLNLLVYNKVKEMNANDEKAAEKALNRARVFNRGCHYTSQYALMVSMHESTFVQELAEATTQRAANIYLNLEMETPEEFLKKYGVDRYQELSKGKRVLYAKRYGLPEGIMSNREIKKQNFELYGIVNKQTARMKQEEIESRFFEVATAEELVSKLSDCKLITFDTETYQKYSVEERPDGVVGHLINDAWQDTPFSLSVCDGTNCYVLYGTDEISKMSEYLARTDVIKVAHNAKFDRTMLENVGAPVKGIIYDTMIMARLIDENKRNYVLEELATACINDYPWKAKELAEYKVKHHTTSYKDIPRELMTPYTCGDVWNCYQLYAWCTDKIKAKGLEELVEQERKVENMLYLMSRNGVHVDTKAVKEMLERTNELTEQLQVQLKELAWKDFNPNAHAQKRRLLLKTCPSYPNVAGLTQAGALSTDKNTLATCLSLEPDNEVLKCLTAYSLLSKADGAYLPNFLKFADKNGYMHPTLNSTQARTGRMSVSDPAMQQIPKDIKLANGEVLSLRGFFTPPEGYAVVCCDLDQIEYRLLAINCGSTSLIDKINNGYDIHSATAALLFQQDLDFIMANKEADKEVKHMRSVAKTMNFSIVYGQGLVQLAKNLAGLKAKGTPTEAEFQEAKQLKERYFNSMPEIEQFISRVSQEFVEQKRVRNYFGRYRNKTDKDGAYKATNALIQGEAADYFKSRLVKIYDWIESEDLWDIVKPVMAIHDELMLYIRLDRLDLALTVQELMCDREAFMADLTADCSVSAKSWADKQAYKGGEQYV